MRELQQRHHNHPIYAAALW